MNVNYGLLRSAITASVLGVFWAVWLLRVSEAVFQAQALRPWTDALSPDMVKWLFTLNLLVSVVLVAALLWSFSSHVSLKASGLPQEDLDHHFRMIFSSFLWVSTLLVILPIAAFVFFGAPTIWEATIAAVVLPLALLFIIFSSD